MIAYLLYAPASSQRVSNRISSTRDAMSSSTTSGYHVIALPRPFLFHARPFEELEIEQGDIFKRLSDDKLREFWAPDSQKGLPDLPIWTKNDGVLQNIANAACLQSSGRYGPESSIPISSRCTRLGSRNTRSPPPLLNQNSFANSSHPL